MISTTTPFIEGHTVTAYKGIVFGEVIQGTNAMRDFAAGLSNIFGGRSNAYEEELMNSRMQAIAEMEQRAQELGANAVIGVDIGYQALGTGNNMIMVTATGTAVVVQ